MKRTAIGAEWQRYRRHLLFSSGWINDGVIILIALIPIAHRCKGHTEPRAITESGAPGNRSLRSLFIRKAAKDQAECNLPIGNVAGGTFIDKPLDIRKQAQLGGTFFR